MATNRIVVVGGVACGPKAAARARRCDPEAKITIIEEGSLVSYAGCGIPYYVSGVVQKRNALLVRTVKDFKSIADIDALVETRVESIDRQAHRLSMVNVANGQASILEYDKLVLATGANPVRPPIEGRELAGIYAVKDVSDADRILAWFADLPVRKAVIVGGGLIGMEMLEVLSTRGMEVTVVEALDHILPGALDAEIAMPVEKYLRRKGIDLRLGERVAKFEGADGRVRRVITSKSSLDADIVIMAIGVRPNVKLAKDAGLAIGPTGAIAVNEYLQTSDPDIYAGGDCVENKNLLTGAPMFAPMGSTANKHGRVIGTNVTGGRETFPGVLGTTIVKVLEFNIGRTGLGEREARAAGFDVVTSLAPETDRPGYFPGSRDIMLKLIVDRKSGRVLGAQGAGKGELAKRIDVMATAITFGADVESLVNIDLAYAPPYNTPQDPVHHAGNVVRNKLAGMAEGITPAQLKAKLDAGEDFHLLDVRTPMEFEKWRIDCPQVRHVPQNALLAQAADLPRGKEIIIICRGGTRAYQAARILKRAGFGNIKFVEGSMVCWPFECLGSDPNDQPPAPAKTGPDTH